MNKNMVEKAQKLLEEINELENIKYFAPHHYRHPIHFELRQHYGDSSQTIVRIDARHNSRLVAVVQEILLELKAELESL